MYTIKQAAEQLGISKVALRYYDKMRILPTKRSQNRYRTYDELDIYVLQNILVLKQAGFSLEDIKTLTALYYEEEGDACNERARVVIEKNLSDIQKQLSFLQLVAKTLEDVYPLFQTHELYKLNQKELETTIKQLFATIKETNTQEDKTND